MLIRHKQVGSKGMFFIQQDGNLLAEMVYTMPAADKMIIEHTEVGDELRGQSAGYQLLQTAVEYARHHSLKIIPLCPFAIPIAIGTVFRKKPEFADVLYTS